MNGRAIGCGALAAAVFVAVGIFGILRAGAPAECPDLLPYEPANYEPVGAATAEPGLEGVPDPLEPAGSTSFGLARWGVYVEPGFAPAASGALLPQRIVLRCGDGTFQAYQRAAE
ncbi:MAG: hypothetical protein QOI85_2350 [Chloroflexota bacterium]|nr:hypothetical protein [Chloroflexota bacterium]